MKKLLAIAALLLASSAAQAQYTFDYGGRTIRIDPDRGTVQIPGVYDNTPKAKRSRKDDDYRDDYRDRPRKQSPQEAKTDSRNPPDAVAPVAPAPAAPAPTEQAAVPPAPAPVPAAPAPVPAAPPEPSTVAVAPAADPVTAPAAPTPPSAPAPQVQQEPPPAPKPSVAAVAPPPPATAPQAANSPLGVWLTEEKEGKVRIEQCGPNLCGYSVDKKSNRNGEQVLINMKPGKDNKWSGRIFDPNSGSTYDSTIAMKGSDGLRVQGCAFGGMFCGGQNWTRVN
jgi:uncharacterized protein (DUF2147 family)